MIRSACIWIKGTALAKTCRLHAMQAMFGTQLWVMVNVFAQAVALTTSPIRSITTLVSVSASSSGLNVNLENSGTLSIATVNQLKNGAQFARWLDKLGIQRKKTVNACPLCAPPMNSLTIRHASAFLRSYIFAHLKKFGTLSSGNASASIAKQIALTSISTLIFAKIEPNHLSAQLQHLWQLTTLITRKLLANAGRPASLFARASEISFSVQNYANACQDATLVSSSTLLEFANKSLTPTVFPIRVHNSSTSI